MSIGQIAANNKKLLFENNKAVPLVLSSLIIGFICVHFNTDVNFDNNEYGNLVLMFAGALLISYAISYVVYHYHPFSKIFLFYGCHTIFIMGFDYLSGAIGRKTTSILGFENWLSVFAFKIIIIAIGIYLWYWLIHFIKNGKLQKMLRY